MSAGLFRERWPERGREYERVKEGDVRRQKREKKN